MSLQIRKCVLEGLHEIYEPASDANSGVLDAGDAVLLKNGRLSQPITSAIVTSEKRLERFLSRNDANGRRFDICTGDGGETGTLFYSVPRAKLFGKQALSGARDLATGEELRLSPIHNPEAKIRELKALYRGWQNARCGETDGFVPKELCEDAADASYEALLESAATYVATAREFNSVLASMQYLFEKNGFVAGVVAEDYRRLAATLDGIDAEFDALYPELPMPELTH